MIKWLFTRKKRLRPIGQPGMNRQIASQLYERLLLNTDKKRVLQVARNAKQPLEANEIIKDPLVLEFLGFKKMPHILRKILIQH